SAFGMLRINGLEAATLFNLLFLVADGGNKFRHIARVLVKTSGRSIDPGCNFAERFRHIEFGKLARVNERRETQQFESSRHFSGQQSAFSPQTFWAEGTQFRGHG